MSEEKEAAIYEIVDGEAKLVAVTPEYRNVVKAEYEVVWKRQGTKSYQMTLKIPTQMVEKTLEEVVQVLEEERTKTELTLAELAARIAYTLSYYFQFYFAEAHQIEIHTWETSDDFPVMKFLVSIEEIEQ